MRKGWSCVVCFLMPFALQENLHSLLLHRMESHRGVEKSAHPVPPDSAPQPNCASFDYSKCGGHSRGRGFLTAKEEETYVRKVALCQPHIRVGDLRCEMALWKKLGALGSVVGGGGVVSVKAAIVAGWNSPETTWGKWRWVRGCRDEEERTRERRKRVTKEDGDTSLKEEATWYQGVSF